MLGFKNVRKEGVIERWNTYCIRSCYPVVHLYSGVFRLSLTCVLGQCQFGVLKRSTWDTRFLLKMTGKLLKQRREICFCDQHHHWLDRFSLCVLILDFYSITGGSCTPTLLQQLMQWWRRLFNLITMN